WERAGVGGRCRAAGRRHKVDGYDRHSGSVNDSARGVHLLEDGLRRLLGSPATGADRHGETRWFLSGTLPPFPFGAPLRDSRGSKLELVPHDSIVFSEAALLVYPPGGGVRGLRDQIHYGEPRCACLSGRRAHETRPDSPTLVVRMDVEFIQLRPALHPAVEPSRLQRRTPHHEPDGVAVRLRHDDPAAAVLHRVVDEEHRVYAAQVPGVIEAERPKPCPGGLPSRHVAFIPPPLAAHVSAR